MIEEALLNTLKSCSIHGVLQLPIANKAENSAKISVPPTRLPRRMFNLLINNSEVRGAWFYAFRLATNKKIW